MDKIKKQGYKSVLKQKQYMKLLAADMINRFGDNIDALTFQWLIFELTGSAAWSAILLGFNWIPTILLQPVFGALAERLDKKKVMVASDVIRGAIVLCFAAVYMSGYLSPWHMLAFTMALSAVEAMRVPTGFAFVSHIVDMECYSFASALNSMVSTVMQLAGIGLAGMMIAVFGAQTAMAVDAATFFISAVLIGWIRPKQAGTPVKVSEKQSGCQADCKSDVKGAGCLAFAEIKRKFNVLAKDFKSGFIYMKDKRYILNLCLMGAVLNAVFTPLNSLLSPLVVGVLGGTSETLSFFGIAMSAGGLVGGFVYPWAGQRICVRRAVLFGGTILSAGYALVALTPFLQQHKAVMYGLLFGGGILLCGGVSFISGAAGNALMLNTDEAYKARIGGIFNSMATMAVPAVSVLVSIFSILISVTWILALSVLLCIIIFAVIAVKSVSFEEERDNGSQGVA